MPIVLEDRLYGGDINKFQITDINYQSNATDYGYEIADGYCEIELKGNYLSHTDENPYVLGDIYFSIYFYDKAGHIVYEGMDAIRYGEGEVTCKVDLYDFSLPIGDYKVVIELYNY